jgi:hypothetical protein
METMRPNPPVDYSDAWYTKAGNAINQSNLKAGQGLRINKSHGGTTIALVSDMDQETMYYAGAWNITQSYAIGDVVYVDPLQTYSDQNGNPLPVCTGSSADGLPPLCAGLFICTRPVPALGYDENMLVNYVAPAYADAGQIINSTTADTYRFYEANVYWPIYPTIPTGSITTASLSGYDVTANINFWAPLSPMTLIHICANNTNTPTYINGVVSGSVFDMNLLPYSGSSGS